MKHLLFVLSLSLALLTSVSFLHARQKETNQLTLYSSPDSQWVALVAKKFEEETGTKVNWIREGSGVVLQKLKAEKAKPQADVWFGGTLDAHAEAARLGLLESFQPPSCKDLLPLFQDPVGKNLSTGLYAGILGFAVNEPLLKKAGKPIPKTWEDLLNPTYKGLISMANPSTSGTAFIILATLTKLKGEKEAFDYLRKLHANIAQYTQSGAAPLLLTGKGETAISIVFLHDVVKDRLQGNPVQEIIPQDGTGYEIGGLSLVKNGPNPEVGKKFIEWALQPRVQELAAVAGALQVPSNSKTKGNPNILPLDSAKLVELKADWMMQHRERLIKKWSDEIFVIAKK